MEILAPVKDLDNAIMVCNLKADAIYCSGPKYSARANAQISFEDLKEIIDYAHLYQTKVYITLNTLIKDENFDEVLDYVDRLCELHIDALIIQDLGLFNIVHQKYPDLDIHISTQMHIHNLQSVAFIYKNGASRVVLARELNLKHIKNIREKYPDLEIETFVHGALCTSYSGQCYYSFFFNTGSGNFGTCQQNCRKCHTLTNKNEHLLSLKDLCIGENIFELNNVSDSLKIEGRLKGKEYLYSCIKYYQSILNHNPDQEMYDLMQVAFNRKYTKGRMFEENGSILGNKNRINNHGLLIGNVFKNDGKWLYLKLNKRLTRLDNIRFVFDDGNENGMVVEKIYQDNCEVDFAKSGIVKIKSDLLINKAEVYLVKTRRYEKKINEYQSKFFIKNDLNVKLEAFINKELKLSIDDRDYYSDFIIEKAKNQGMSLMDISKQLSKTNDTPFNFNIECIGDDNIFVAKSLLNDFRRKIISNEINAIVDKKPLESSNYSKISLNKNESFNTYFMIRTLEQAKALSDFKIDKVYVDNLEILDEVNEMFDNIIPVMPRVIKDDVFMKLVKKVEKYSTIMVSELGMLNYFKNKKEIETNFSLNIINRYSLSMLKENNVKKSIISLESDSYFSIDGIESVRFAYGYLPLMIMDYCLINQNKKNDCNGCTLCQDKQYYVYDDNNRKLPLVYRGNSLLEVYSNKPLNVLSNKKSSSEFIFFTIENYDKTIEILKSITF
ncbi:putative protease [Bacilli bacterium PM5-9]|nr:putative protease [Bacilli bacterium PM5-9]